VIDSGLVGSTNFHSSHPQGHEPEHSERGTTRAEDAQGTPTQSHISPSILVYEYKGSEVKVWVVGFSAEGFGFVVCGCTPRRTLAGTWVSV